MQIEQGYKQNKAKIPIKSVFEKCSCKYFRSVDFLFSIEIGQGDFISSSVFHLFFSLMFSTSHPTYFWKRIRSRRIKVRGKQEVKQLKNSCTKSFGGFQKGIFSLKKNLNQVITNAERRARQELKKSPNFLTKSKSDAMHITTQKFELSRKVNQVQLYRQRFPSYP